MKTQKPLLGTKLFMIDLDGTFYLGEQLLPGAREFLAACKRLSIPYTFLSNNSSHSSGSYHIKLNGVLGVETDEEEIFTSGDATIAWLRQQGVSKKLLLIGTRSLQRDFVNAGFDVTTKTPAAVVLGFDTELSYEKLCALCAAVKAGLPYIATHPDLNCPVPGGEIPDIGATIAYVKAATGREPDVIVGKPNPIIAQMAAARAGCRVDQLCMVGDRLYTDIALGANAGLATVLVLSGETDAAALAASEVRPDHVFDNLAGLTAALLAEAGLSQNKA